MTSASLAMWANVLTATAFVLFMTVPGLALFYTGMVRTKNSLSTVMQSFTIFCVIAVLWVVYGYSVAFTAGNPFFGSLDKLFMGGEDGVTAVAATFSKGVYIPDFVFAMFQLTFAAITVALICGGYAERFGHPKEDLSSNELMCPEPFLWLVLESLVDAGLLMERGDVDNTGLGPRPVR